jgi:molybdopterin converting factor small subunit
MAAVTLRYWAAAKEAAGVAEEKVEALTLADALTAGLEAVAKAAQAAGCADRAERYTLVLARSSFLINGDPAGTRSPESVLLPDDAVIEVLPPFAGG